ncbi:MAG: C10 family peptidase, partial [Bacteroidales bacterium]|nr:C10 family peptidase [Bacteroidales bacterium]
YNAQCPVDVAGPCGRVYTGCVATAMAQVIRYLEWPVNGVGSRCYTHYNYGELCADYSAATYDYSIMPNGSGNAEVAELMYHCGVSVSMGYSPTGSGAYSSSVPTALRNYFDYKNVVILSKSSYTDDAWHNILRNEIDNSRPIYYSGHGSGGHAFVFDGYQGTDYFHVNWGWGGSYNGYFYTNDLTPGSSNFTNSQNAVIGAIPSPLFTNLDFSSATVLSCATPLSQDLSTGNDHINYYKNTYPTTPGKELVYEFTTTLPGRIRIKIDNVSEGSMYAMLLSHPHQDSLITYGTNGFILDDTNPGTYYLAVENNAGLEPTFDIEVICPTIDAELIITNGTMIPEYVESLQNNINFNCTVKNIGNTAAGSCGIEYYISDDMVFDFGTDILIGSDVVPALAPGASSNVHTILSMPAGLTSGSKNIVYVVDRLNTVVEADDQNEYFSWATVPDPGLLDCTSAFSIVEDTWYYDNTLTNGINNVEDYWAATDLDGKELIYSFVAPYSGAAKLWLTEKTPGQMYCMAYPVCNENTWLGSVWFNQPTDTLGYTDFYVSAGTEYFVVVDSKVQDSGEFGIKLELPDECPAPVIEYWGDLDLCDGDPLPKFWTYWGFPNYQWYKNGVPITDAIRSNYMPEDAGTYYVEVTENGCSGQSAPITINVSYAPDTATIASLGLTEFCEGGSVIIEMTNAVSASYQWTLNGEAIAGETSSQITAEETGTYRLNTINGYCSLESADFVDVTVNPNPEDIGDTSPVPSSSPEFYYSFNDDAYDDFNNYSFSCWDYLPTNDRDGNFWQARNFTDADVFGYSSHYYNLPAEFTHTLWFKTSTTEGGVLLTFVNNPWGPTSQDATLYMSDDGKLHFWMSNGGTPAEISTVSSYNDGNWHSVLIAHGTGILMETDGGAETVQIGTPVSHLTFQGYWTFAGPSVPATVSSVPTSAYFNGILDDMMCVNEDKYILRNYLDEFPEITAEVQGSDHHCGSGLAYFNVLNSQFGINYRVWNNTLSSWNGIATSGTGGPISIGGDLISSTCDFVIYATDPVTLCETVLDTVFTITVDPVLTPAISISGDGSSPMCSGTTVHFTANISNAGLNPTIEWYFNGIAQGVNNVNFSHEFDNSSDDVYAIVTSDYICPAVPTATSNTILYTVVPVLTPLVSISETPSGTVCTETIVDFTATDVDCGANPDFEWYLNGVHAGLNSDSYSHAGWTDGDEVYVVVLPDYMCPSSPSVQSNTITISVSTPPESGLTIISGGYCTGEDVCFEYSGETIGLDHVEWGVSQGGPITNFIGAGPHCYTPVAGYLDIWAYAYDVHGCYDTAWFFSPAISGSVSPSVSITTTASGPICSYYGIGFEAHPVNCGLNPSYQWYRNGVEVGTNSDSYFDFNWTNNDDVHCIVTNSLSCATSPTAESNHLLIEVSAVPESSIASTGGNCTGDEICLNYNGTYDNLDHIEWEISDGSTFYFMGAGPHCFVPTTNHIHVIAWAYNSMGCVDSANLAIDITGIAPDIDIYDTIYRCSDWPTFFDAPAGFESYEWSDGQTSSHFVTYVEGLYYLTVTNSQGCTDVDSLLVIDYPDNGFDWPPDTTLCTTQTIHLELGYPYLTYEWWVGSDYLTTESVDVVYDGSLETIVSVYATDENCSYGDTMYIHFEVCEFVDLPE